MAAVATGDICKELIGRH